MLHKKNALPISVYCLLLLLLSACSNNGNTPAHSVDSVFITIDTSHFLPCIRDFGTLVPWVDSVGQEGVLQMGRVKLIQKNTGLKEYPIGDYNTFHVTMQLDGKNVWTADSILSTAFPRITADSAWFTWQLATYPGEYYSKTAFYLYNIPLRQLTLIDSALFTMVEPAIITIEGKTFVFYVDGDCLCCFDVEKRHREELAWLKFEGFSDDYFVSVEKVYNIAFQNGKLAGNMQLNADVSDIEGPGRCGSFSIDWRPGKNK